MVWTTPDTVVDGDVLTASWLNTQLRDNMLFLKTKPIVIKNVTGLADTTITSSTFVAVNDTYFNVDLTTTGNPVRVSINGNVHNTATWYLAGFDVLIDGTTYLSSGAGTPLTYGTWVQLLPGSSYTAGISCSYYYSGLPAGTHNFRLRARTTGASNLVVHHNTEVFQMVVEEI